jgi:PBP1b-binding outer membrane lipoprotein LpoB
MKKITLLFLATILTFVISSCSKTEEVAPITIVGKWTASGIGAITDTKIYDATVEDIRKLDPKTADSLAIIKVEYKADGTYLFNKDKGTYKVSADSKTLTLTSTINKDSKGVFNVQIIDIPLLSATEFKMGLKKLTKKTTDKEYTVAFDESFLSYLYAIIAINVKDQVNADAIEAKSISLQGTLNFKR